MSLKPKVSSLRLGVVICSNSLSVIFGKKILVKYLDKSFYNLSKKILCPNMKITTLIDVLNTIKGIDTSKAFEIIMTEEEINKARICIDEMIRLGQ